MSRPALAVLVCALLLVAFGWWGLETDAGRRRFDEMAGMIPAAAFWGGLLVGAIALVGLAVSLARSGA